LRAGDSIDDLDCDKPPGCVRCRSDMTAWGTASGAWARPRSRWPSSWCWGLVRHLVPRGRVASVPRGWTASATPCSATPPRPTSARRKPGSDAPRHPASGPRHRSGIYRHQSQLW